MGSAEAQASELLATPIELIKWLEQQDEDSCIRCASNLCHQLLGEAGQPKSVSGQACIRLCGLVDQSSKSKSMHLRNWATSRDNTLALFNFYMEWSESDNHQSMKLVLDLVARFLLLDPQSLERQATKKAVLDSLVSIVIGRSTKPVAKSALKTLEHFLTKGVCTLSDVKSTYVSFRNDISGKTDVEVWRSFTFDLLHWMRQHFVCPTAGRLIACIYRQWRQLEDGNGAPDIEDWHQWLLDFVKGEPRLLESVKNYLFLPLFKADRQEALLYLKKLNKQRTLSNAVNVDMDMAALLQLAALETGKKVGLVEEPNLGGTDTDMEATSIILDEKVLESVLSHPTHEVRALALSLLVTSPSTTRPYSQSAFDLLQRHLGAFFADADAKFRVDVSAKSKDMFKRVRGAIHVLKRSIPRARAKARPNPNAAADAAGQEAAATKPILYRSNLISLPEAQLTRCLDSHIKFLHWYLSFLCHELTPTASYQRHIASLKALMYITRMEGEGKAKTWETEDDQELFFDRFDAKWSRALCDLTTDAFEDVRHLSTAALARCYGDGRYRRLLLSGGSGESGKVPVQDIKELQRRANDVAQRTSRADHSDGASQVSQLLYRFLQSVEERVAMLSGMVEGLERKTAVAEQDLGQAVVDTPLHSDFASISHTWLVVSEMKLLTPELEAVQNLQSRIVSCCERAWEAVRDILCDDSPEGHLPQELEEVDGLDTKDLLSFSFRAVHEASNLMRTIILTIRNGPRDGHVVPSKDVYERIGNLTFTQLANLRHRGAFNTVAATFAACCQQSKHLAFAEHEKTLLDVWYAGTMDVIHTQASTTRRSAGIPSMIVGILAANAARPAFSDVMDSLMEIAGKEAKVSETDGSNLPQVHAYNCLKDIFRNSLLASIGNRSETYLPQCLELAASGLRSEVWAIRNCGLIFLRSLINVLFGTTESKVAIEAGWDGKGNRIHYHRYPTLPAVIMNLLRSGHQMLASSVSGTSVAAESVFPALDIIRRAGPPDTLRDDIQVHVAAYLSSPVWHVRDMAARTLCSCLLHDKWLSVIKKTLQDAVGGTDDGARHNHVHGVLLALKLVIERLSEVSSDRLLDDLPELVSFVKDNRVDALFPACPDVTVAYIAVINSIWAFETARQLPLSSLSASMPANHGSALLKIQKAIYDTYRFSGKADSVVKLKTLLLGKEIGHDGLVAALETLPQVWSIEKCGKDKELLSSLCGLYVETCLAVQYAEAQVIALQNAADALDMLLSHGPLDERTASSLVTLWTGLSLQTASPAMSNAITRLSGCITVALASSPETRSIVDLGAWGDMMADAGLDDKAFDTRFAAVTSLRSFFSVKTTYKEDCLPALLALYDALNDDDDEVREAAADAARNVVGDALVPIEAANCVLDFLVTSLGDSAAMKQIVADRLVGAGSPTWPEASEQLGRAMAVDDSLFAVEEQNLFVDEVRETKRWLSVFQSMRWNGESTLRDLTGWVTRGVAHVGSLAKKKDGPLGWASNPHVFAVCMRVILCSTVLLLQDGGNSDLSDAVATAKHALESADAQVSGLLMEGWGHI